jgi:N-acetylglucosamine kinase-like BadF-type ATPase
VATGAKDANDALHRFYTQEYPRPRIASFSGLVDEACADGDEVAASILNNAAQQLAMLAAAIRRQLWRENETTRIAYIGGAFKSTRLLERFKLLVEMERGNRCGPPDHDPAAGALLEAYRAAGLRLKLI